MCRLKSAKQYKKPFICPHCLQRPDVQAHLAKPPPSQPLQVDIPDGTGQSSGLTQGILNMNISDSVRKAPEPSAKTVLEDIRAAQYQVLKFIPKASRTNFALTLSSTITKIISNPSDVDNWRRLLLMPKICLKAPPRAGQKTSLATLVNRQIGNLCQNEDLTSLLGVHRARKLSKKKKWSARPNLISSKIDESNIRGAVRIASSADETEPPKIRSLEVLKIKHPEAPNDRRPFTTPGDDIDSIEMSIELVRDAINSFAPGSAGGPPVLRTCFSWLATRRTVLSSTVIMSLIPRKASNKAFLQEGFWRLLYGNTGCSNLYAVTIQSWIPGWYSSRR